MKNQLSLNENIKAFRSEQHAKHIGFAMKSVLSQVLETIENRYQKGARKLSFGLFSVLGRPCSTYAQFLKMLRNSAKSLFVDVALNVNKIDQKGSKGAPGTAWVVLVGVSGSPGGPAEG